jgi:hypothetical protein
VSINRLFRKDPLITTVATAAAMNVLIGALEGQALLAFLGVVVVSGAIAIRGWQTLRRSPPRDFAEPSPQRYLPEQTSRPAVPTVELSSRRYRNYE